MAAKYTDWRTELAKVANCPQRQDSLDAQLNDLINIANKFGFYDAADFLKNSNKLSDGMLTNGLNKKAKVKLKDITVGFEFQLNGEIVVVKTDYELWDKNFKSVQIVHANNRKLSAGQMQKDLILQIVNVKQ